ncbi:MAG TPA: hypothetical protein VK427_04015, partial [Kofleriaceae bacterium]|nr:hypothetical protein [Kofleriaceae bacterium]
TEGTFTIVEGGTDSVQTFAVSVTPSFKVDKDVALFGGLTVRQHPTIEQKGTTMGTVLDDVEVDSGPANFIVSAGVEAGLAGGSVLLSAIGYYDLTRDPAKYGPGLAVMVSLPLGKRRSQQPAPAPVYAPPAPPYAPPAPPPGGPPGASPM